MGIQTGITFAAVYTVVKNRCFAISVICKQCTLLQKERIWIVSSLSPSLYGLR